jgi:hypothetical protein
MKTKQMELQLEKYKEEIAQHKKNVEQNLETFAAEKKPFHEKNSKEVIPLREVRITILF